MRTMTFAQAQFAYDNMLPDYEEDVDVQDLFDQDFKGGQIVMTPDGTGIVTGNHYGAMEEDADEDGICYYPCVTTIEVAVPFCGKTYYKVSDILVKKKGDWVSA